VWLIKILGTYSKSTPYNMSETDIFSHGPKFLLSGVIIHSRRDGFLLICFPNCIAHVVCVPRSRDLQNTYYFTVFHISSANVLWTDCEDSTIAGVYCNIVSQASC